MFFDLGETLVTQNIEDNLVTKKALERLSNELVTNKTPEQLFELYNRGYQHNQPIRSTHNVEIPITSWMRELLRHAVGEEPSAELVGKAAKIVVESRATNAKEYPDARGALDELESRCRIGVISNVSSHDVAFEILRHVGFDKYVDLLVTSASIGIRKPDPGIFLYSLSQMNVEADQSVHVGDHPVNDVDGAYSVGIQTALILRSETSTTKGVVRPWVTLKDLNGLPALILR